MNIDEYTIALQEVTMGSLSGKIGNYNSLKSVKIGQLTSTKEFNVFWELKKRLSHDLFISLSDVDEVTTKLGDDYTDGSLTQMHYLNVAVKAGSEYVLEFFKHYGDESGKLKVEFSELDKIESWVFGTSGSDILIKHYELDWKGAPVNGLIVEDRVDAQRLIDWYVEENIESEDVLDVLEKFIFVVKG